MDEVGFFTRVINDGKGDVCRGNHAPWRLEYLCLIHRRAGLCDASAALVEGRAFVIFFCSFFLVGRISFFKGSYLVCVERLFGARENGRASCSPAIKNLVLLPRYSFSPFHANELEL